jgi:hypothetical protein
VEIQVAVDHELMIFLVIRHILNPYRIMMCSSRCL